MMKFSHAVATNLFTKAALGTCLVLLLIGSVPVTGWGQKPRAPEIVSFDPPGSNGTFPTCVNDRSMIVGEALTVGVSYNVFIRKPNGAYTTFALSSVFCHAGDWFTACQISNRNCSPARTSCGG